MVPNVCMCREGDVKWELMMYARVSCAPYVAVTSLHLVLSDANVIFSILTYSNFTCPSGSPSAFIHSILFPGKGFYFTATSGSDD